MPVRPRSTPGRIKAGVGSALRSRLKQHECLSAPVLTVPQVRETRGCAQLARQGILSARGIERLPKVILGRRRLARCSPHHQKLFFAAKELLDDLG
jgi:hypothetical protein